MTRLANIDGRICPRIESSAASHTPVSPERGLSVPLDRRSFISGPSRPSCSTNRLTITRAFHVRARCQVPQGRRRAHDRPSAALDSLRLSGGTLKASADHEPDRGRARDGPVARTHNEDAGSRMTRVTMAFNLLAAAQGQWRRLTALNSARWSARAFALSTACPPNGKTSERGALPDLTEPASLVEPVVAMAR
jgi:hypothetical protein